MSDVNVSVVYGANGLQFTKTEQTLPLALNVVANGIVGPAGPTGPTGATGATGATGPAGPAPAGTGLVSVTGGVLDTPSTLSARVAADAANLRTQLGLGDSAGNDGVTTGTGNIVRQTSPVLYGPIGVNVASAPETPLKVGRGPLVDESEIFRSYNTDELTNDMTRVWNLYAANHLKLNGFNLLDRQTVINGSHLTQGTGTANYVIMGNFRAELASDSPATVTNPQGVRIGIVNSSTVGGTMTQPAAIYIAFSGAGTNGSPHGIWLIDNQTPISGTAYAIRIQQNTGTGTRWAISSEGTAPSRFNGVTQFNADALFRGQAEFANGSAAAPAATFEADNDTGIYRNNSKSIGFSTAGVGRWQIGNTGNFLPLTANAFSIGATGSEVQNIRAAGEISTTTGDIVVGTGGQLRFQSNGRIGVSSDGLFNLLNGAATQSGTLLFSRRASTKTADYTVLSTESGMVFDNAGAAGQVTFTLPAISSTYRQWYTFTVRTAQSLRVVAATGETIRIGDVVSAAAGNITANTVGATITIQNVGTDWRAVSNPSGTWSVDGSVATPVNRGSGSPEGVVTAPVGTMWLRSNGGANTTLYIKESGTGNTGWVAK